METGIASLSKIKGHSIHPYKFRPFRVKEVLASDQAGIPP